MRLPVLWAATGSTALLLVLGGTPAALAGPPPSTAAAAPATGVAVHRSTRSPAEAAAAADAYWTPARMRVAVPADARAGRAGPAAARSGAPGQLARAVHPGGSAGTLALTAPATQGKVYFHNATDGRDYVCSAGVVNNPAKDMVFTAGHCVHGGAGGTWHTNWVFVPQYYDGSRPYGTWSYHYLTTFNGWITSSDLNYDIGVVNVYPLNGQALVNRVGGAGLVYNYGYRQTVTIWGYPSAFGYSGEIPYYCQNVVTYQTGSRVGAGCAMVEGASGGPWLKDYDTTTGLGNQYAVTSTRSEPVGSIQSPYFDGKILTIWNATKDL
ncbi:MAG: trypsin-like serine peptidase [Mycobacteriales bacterium]